ncbi:hypothetical protein UlMin_012389 [Ulmus minor]
MRSSPIVSYAYVRGSYCPRRCYRVLAGTVQIHLQITVAANPPQNLLPSLKHLHMTKAFDLAIKTRDRFGRRHVLTASVIGSLVSLVNQNSLSLTDQKDGYTFVYPFGWQEIVIEGQDKVLKDVIEPLENVSINYFPKNKQDIGEFGPPQQVAETLIKKVLAPANQKKKLLSILQCRWEKMPKILKHALESLSMKSESSCVYNIVWTYGLNFFSTTTRRGVVFCKT